MKPYDIGERTFELRSASCDCARNVKGGTGR